MKIHPESCRIWLRWKLGTLRKRERMEYRETEEYLDMFCRGHPGKCEYEEAKLKALRAGRETNYRDEAWKHYLEICTSVVRGQRMNWSDEKIAAEATKMAEVEMMQASIAPPHWKGCKFCENCGYVPVEGDGYQPSARSCSWCENDTPTGRAQRGPIQAGLVEEAA